MGPVCFSGWSISLMYMGCSLLCGVFSAPLLGRWFRLVVNFSPTPVQSSVLCGWPRSEKRVIFYIVNIHIAFTITIVSTFITAVFLRCTLSNSNTVLGLCPWEILWFFKAINKAFISNRIGNDPQNPLTNQPGTFTLSPTNMIYKAVNAPCCLMKWWANLGEHDPLAEKHLVKCTD